MPASGENTPPTAPADSVRRGRLSLDERQLLPSAALLLVAHDARWMRHPDHQTELRAALYALGDVEEMVVDEEKGMVKVVFRHTDRAVGARSRLENSHRLMRGTAFDVEFAKIESPSAKSMSYLQVPALTKQFLISPPASPPVGWEPTVEDAPVINTSLVAALMTMDANVPYELHPATGNMPAIHVVNCSTPSRPDTPQELDGQASGASSVSVLSAVPSRPSIVCEDTDALASSGLVLRPGPAGEKVMPQTRRPPLTARLHAD